MTTDTSTHESTNQDNHDVHDGHHVCHGNHDPADTDYFGFFVYIMSDCLLFATLFATFAVLSDAYGSGIHPRELFVTGFVLTETMLLLTSSFTFGMAMLGAHNKDMAKMKKWLIFTFALGFSFLMMEFYEFYHFSHEGATPQTSAFWSAFYALVATHGIHVTVGLVWLVTMIFHFKREGFSEKNMVRLSCLSLFWHFLDIIWVCVYSFVYLAKVL